MELVVDIRLRNELSKASHEGYNSIVRRLPSGPRRAFEIISAKGNQMASDLNNLLNRVRDLQTMLEAKLEESVLMRDLKKYAASQQKVLKKKINSSADIKKVVTYVEKQRKHLDKVAKNLPKEVATVGKFVKAQRKEFEKLGKKLIQELSTGDLKAASATARRATTTKTKKRTTKSRSRRASV